MFNPRQNRTKYMIYHYTKSASNKYNHSSEEGITTAG